MPVKISDILAAVRSQDWAQAFFLILQLATELKPHFDANAAVARDVSLAGAGPEVLAERLEEQLGGIEAKKGAARAAAIPPAVWPILLSLLQTVLERLLRK